MPQVIPPANLLERVDGVEAQLERGRRLGLVGWGAFLFSAGSVVVAVATSNFWSSASHIDWSAWPFWVPVAMLALSLLFINWTRVWVNASRQPFRYTYSIAQFDAIGDSDDLPRSASGASTPPLRWLVQDLSERLSRRIGRLSLLDEAYSGETKAPEAHIHISGSYGVRQSARGEWVVEVLPWVRVGPTGASATVAHLVKFTLGQEPELEPETYEKLVERIYFSIASHLYTQIRGDVGRKIDLLPKRFFRASAYFHEARDYARSNTLDAHEQARELYAEAIRLYDPTWWVYSEHRLRRWLQGLMGWAVILTLRIRARAAEAWPRFARVELMVAQAEIGYARTLLSRRSLAGMAGQRLNSIFEARPVAQSAIGRLDRVPRDVPEWRDTQFDALVTLAAAYAQLGSARCAQEHLEQAKKLDPSRVEQDARFLHVRGRLVETRRALTNLVRAVEIDPTFEEAEFDLAITLEMLWRARPMLESDVADTVREEYDRVLTLNPGNIAAWANLGYMEWLLGDLDRAARVFERGREYKEIKRETFVSEIDYGLARIAAEQGDFKDAYRHYIDAVSARFSQGVAHNEGYTAYHFAHITRAVVRRFENYRMKVERERERASRTLPADDTSMRVRDSVYAFVLNDYAEACFNYFLRSGNPEYLAAARSVLEDAVDGMRTTYAMLYFNLARVLTWDDDVDRDSVGDRLERVVELQPDWIDGKLERALWCDEDAKQSRIEAELLTRAADEAIEQAKELEAQARELRVEGEDARFDTRAQSKGDVHSLLQPAAGVSAAPGTSAPEDGSRQRLLLRQLEPTGGRDVHARLELHAPLQSGPSLEAEAAAATLEQNAAKKRDAWHRNLADAAAKLANARERSKEALSTVEELLPHVWLWTTEGETRAISERALTDEEFRSTRKWERELEPVHVTALVSWGRLDASKTTDAGRRVLEFVRERFLPDDVGVLTELFEARPRGNDRAAALRELVKSWIENEHAWWALKWIDFQDLFDPKEKALLLIKVARTDRSLPDKLFLELASRLDRLAAELEESHAALAAQCRKEAKGCHERIDSKLADAAVMYELATLLEERGGVEALTQALGAYAAADDIDRRQGYKTNHATVYRRARAVLYWKLEQFGEALSELEAIDAAGLAQPWRSELVGELIEWELVESPESYRRLKDWLGRVLTAGRQNPEVRRDASDAILRLTLQRYLRLARRQREPDAGATLSEGMAPAVPAVILEGDSSSLFPAGEETKGVKQMIDEHIPQMRRDVERDVGISVPPVQILSREELGYGRYTILIDGAAELAGRLDPELVFCPDLEACRSLGLVGIESVDPLRDSGPGGLWVPADDVPEGLQVMDCYEYMIRHVEAVVRRNVDSFYGVDEAARSLDALALDTGDADSRVWLAAVSRSLLREGIPLRLREEDAAFVAESNGSSGELPAFVERVRGRLANAIPGTHGMRPVVFLRPAIEQQIAAGIRRRNGKEFLAFRPDTLQDIVAALEDQLGSLEPGTALVARQQRVRPFVRRLLLVMNHGTPVLAYAELSPDARLKVEDPTLAPAVETFG